MMLILVAAAGLISGVAVERLVTSLRDRPASPASVYAEVATSRRPPRRGRLALRLTAVALAAILVAVVGGLIWANVIFNRIEKVEVSDALSSSSGTNWLLVGADNALGDGPGRVGGDETRCDTEMVIRILDRKQPMHYLNHNMYV